MVSGALACLLHAASILLLILLTNVPIPPRPAPVPLEVTFLPAPQEPVALKVEPAPAPEEKAGSAASPSPRGDARSPGPAPEVMTALPSPLPALLPLPSGSPGAGGVGTGTGIGEAGEGSGIGAPGSGQGRDGPAGRTMTGPDWIVRPTDAQMRTYFPRSAIERRTNGVAWLGCQVDARNRARHCRILGETPRGLGFGAAGLRFSRLFRIRPPRRDGRDQYDAWVRIPIYFEIR
jgi:protein TonB